MKFHTFATYDDYLDAQLTLSRHKLTKDVPRCHVTPAVVAAVRAAYGTVPAYGCCHGVRAGVELGMFSAVLGGSWVGSELVPEVCDGKWIVCHDFNNPHRAWRGRFDVMFTNSLDHAHDPVRTVAVWLTQLYRGGRLYIEWTPWHARLGRHWQADCFAADMDEYLEMLDSLGPTRKIQVLDSDIPNHIIFEVRSP